MALPGCGGDSRPTVKVVSDLSLQGNSEQSHQQMVRAIEYVINKFNKKYDGDARVPRIEFESMDHSTAAGGWDAGRCVDNARRYVSDKAIVGVIGTAASGCAAYEIPILNKEGVAMVSPADTAVALTKGGPGTVPGQPERYYPSGKRSFVRLVASDDYQGRVGAKFMKSRRVARVYVLNDKGLYGKGVADAFRYSAKEQDLKIVGHEAWDKDPTTYPALITRIRNSRAEGVYLAGGLSNNGRQLVNEILDETEGVMLLVSDGFVSSSIFPVGSSGDEVFGTFPAGSSTVPCELKKALERVEPDTYVEPYTVYAAAAAEVLLDAISRSKSREDVREDVIAKLFTTNLKTVVGRMSFDGDGDPAGAGEKDFVVYRARKELRDGEQADIWKRVIWRRIDPAAGRADTCKADMGA